MKKRLSLACAVLAAALAPATDAAQAAGGIFPFEVHETTLDNGLSVLAIPYDSPGIVAYVSVVRTGSRDEVEPGHSGFAHFFEHMMFRGTERYSQDEYNDVLKGMGADSNAFTSDDLTVYHIVGPASELPTMFDLESDRFENLEYSEDDFRTEALAVLGEYNKNASSPFLPMYERMRELAFDVHTYAHTTLGFLEDIQKMPGYYDYSLRFFDRFYRPENVVLVIVGDIDAERVAALAKAHYGDWERGYEPPAVKPEPPPDGAERGHIDWPNPTRPYLMIGYRTPAFSPSRDWAALEIIGELLFAEAAPLYQELVVDEQWADTLSGGPDPHRDPYLLEIFSRVKSEELLPKVEAAIEKHLDRLEQEPVEAERIARAASHLRYDFALGLDSPRGVAFEVAQIVALTGEVEPLNELYRQLEKVTPADVQRMAKRVFTDRGKTVVTLAHRAPDEGAETSPPSPEEREDGAEETDDQTDDREETAAEDSSPSSDEGGNR